MVPLTSLLDDSRLSVTDAQRSAVSEILSLSPEQFDRIAEELLKTLRQDRPRAGVLALLGVRGAGKSTVGARVASVLGIPFVEPRSSPFMAKLIIERWN